MRGIYQYRPLAHFKGRVFQISVFVRVSVRMLYDSNVLHSYSHHASDIVLAAISLESKKFMTGSYNQKRLQNT